MTAQATTVFGVQPEIDRDYLSRPLVIPPDGGKPKAYTRCTTYVDCLDDKFKLGEWQQRMVAIGLSQRNDLLLAVASLAPDLMRPSDEVSPETKKRATAIVDKAREAAAASAAATTGTALHALTERLDRGQSLGVIPHTARADLAAYEAATKPLTALHVERFMVNDELRIGGTPDRIVDFEGRTYIADVKTGSVDYAALKIAMQLAVYAHSRLYDIPSGRRSDVPQLDQQRAIVIHLPAGKGECSLRWVDIAAGWEAVAVATQVREWRRRRDLMSVLSSDVPLPYDEPPPPSAASIAAADAHADLANAVASAATVDDLGALWRAHQSAWTDELTQLAAARKALLSGGAVA